MANRSVYEITNTVDSFIDQHKMIGNAKKVYVATSGGADSMALLAYMTSIANTYDIEVGAVHVNHGIRGETARRDANFVRDYCQSHNIEYMLFDAEADGIDVPENASEDWARKLRYGYFEKLINKTTKIATAHTLSDQAETVLFRMARGGSGINGMSGIPAVRGDIIRPFLCIGREDVETLVEYYGTGNITDETNLGDVYSRNKIRHNIIPIMKDINPSFEKSIGKLCERFDKAQKYIANQARVELTSAEVVDGCKYTSKEFFRADDIILDEMLLQLLGKYGIQSEQNITSIKNGVINVKSSGCTGDSMEICNLSNRYRVYITRGYITLVSMDEVKRKIPEVGVNKFGNFGYDVVIEEVSADEYLRDTADKFRLCLYTSETKFDPSKAVLEGICTGDKFKPACKTGGSVTKFTRSVPIAERHCVPIIRYNGDNVWLWGTGFTDGFTPSNDDIDTGKKIYRITWN